MNPTIQNKAVNIFLLALLAGCNQISTSPCESDSIDSAVVVELGLAAFDAVDGIKPIAPFRHTLQLVAEEQQGPDRIVCSANLKLAGSFEVVLPSVNVALGDAAPRVGRGVAVLEDSTRMEIDALAKAEPDQYVPYETISNSPALEARFFSMETELAIPVRYAVDPQRTGELLGLKLDDDAPSSLVGQIHSQMLGAAKDLSRELGEQAAKEASAYGFDSVAAYQAAKRAEQEARQRVESLVDQLGQAKAAQPALEEAADNAQQTLQTAKRDYDKAAAEYRQFMSAVKAGDSSSHPDILKFSSLRLEQGDRGRVKIKGKATNVSKTPLNRWIADVYMYRPDLDRTFVAVGHSFSFYRSGDRINPGETKSIDEWIVGFNTLDRGGNTTEKVFRNVKPATVHMAHTKIIDVNRNNVITPIKDSKDLRRLMERPEKALQEAKSALATANARLQANRKSIESLTNELDQAKQALAKAALRRPNG